jgi:hypothetical protein
MNENVDSKSIDHKYANITAKNIEVIEGEQAPNDTKTATSDGNGRAEGNGRGQQPQSVDVAGTPTDIISPN